MRLKGLAAIAIAGVLMASLTGCGGGNKAAASDSNTVVWNMWAGSQDDTNALNAQLAIVKKQNPDIKVKLETAPWNDYFTKLTANLSSGNVACITSMNSAELSTYYTAFEPLTSDMLAKAGIDLSKFAPGTTDILKRDGKLYGLPFDVSTMLVFYNKEMLQAAGAPEPTLNWTFNDFENIAKKATTPQHKGFAVALGDFQWQALPIAKAGVQPVTKDDKLDLTNPKFEQAADWYQGLVTDEKVADPADSASDTGWGETQFNNGNVAMAVDGTWNAVSYFKNNDGGFTAGATRLPTGDNGSLGLILGSGYGISKSCPNKDAALKVLGSLLSKESMDSIASSGRSYPALTASQPLYFQSLPASYRDQVKAAFDASFKGAQAQLTTDNWAQVNTAIQPQLVSAYNGDTKISSILKSVQSQFGQ